MWTNHEGASSAPGTWWRPPPIIVPHSWEMGRASCSPGGESQAQLPGHRGTRVGGAKAGWGQGGGLGWWGQAGVGHGWCL